MTERLIQILGKEAALFESFLQMLEQQQAMLVSNDADGLSEVSETIREKVTESCLLNKQREEEVERIKSANAIEGDLNVSRLLEIVDENQADQLVKLRNLIHSLHDKITMTRNQNAMVINRSRDSIARMMELLSRVNGPDRTYTRPGTPKRTGDNVVVDRRA